MGWKEGKNGRGHGYTERTIRYSRRGTHIFRLMGGGGCFFLPFLDACCFVQRIHPHHPFLQKAQKKKGKAREKGKEAKRGMSFVVLFSGHMTCPPRGKGKNGHEYDKGIVMF